MQTLLIIAATAVMAAAANGQGQFLPEFRTLKSFGFADRAADFPNSSLIEAADGALYGTTVRGGTESAGTIFKVNKDGSGYAVLHSFAPARGDGKEGTALIEGTDGALYGATQSGGSTNAGTIYKLNPDGSGYTLLHSFQGPDGRSPLAELLEGKDGALYGTTAFGGLQDGGTVFRVNKDGSGYRVLRDFEIGYEVIGAVVEGRNGDLFGTVMASDLGGTVFKLKEDGTGYAVVKNFGLGPTGSLILGSDGALYGVTYYGGLYNEGSIYRLNEDGTDFSSFSFSSARGDGSYPIARLLEGSDGALYGAAEGGYGTVFKLNKDGSAFSVLHSFTYASPGVEPRAGLIEGSDGALYGTTAGGSVVFRLNKDGSGYEIVYFFSASGGDGSGPAGQLFQGSDLNLYGVTGRGGQIGGGTVFKMAADGSSYTILHSFGVGDGRAPMAGVIEGSDGGLYGSTYAGTDNPNGTVFKLNKDGGGYVVLHRFGAPNDGFSVYGGLVEGTDRVLYGTTFYGGSSYFGGTVFKVNKDGSGYSLVHSFTGNGIDGLNPVAGVIEGSDGALYGTTSRAFGGIGAVYKVDKDGSGYMVLHRFNLAGECCTEPVAGVVQGPDGALYGTTVALPGTPDTGAARVVYRLNKDGSGYTELHRFNPMANPTTLLVVSDGTLYGMTSDGGELNIGTVFALTFPPELPRMTRIQASDKVINLELLGRAGQEYQIQAVSQVLAPNWEVVGYAKAGSNGFALFSEAASSTNAARFYRAAEAGSAMAYRLPVRH